MSSGSSVLSSSDVTPHSNFGGYGSSYILWLLVLPESKNEPAFLAEPFVRLSIALDISSQFRGPPLAVSSRCRAVLLARMPKAAVYEDCHSTGREGDVGSPAHAGNGAVIDAITEASRMQKSAHCELRAGVPAPLDAHAQTHLGGGCPRSNQVLVHITRWCRC
jgi:hypothetical protein